MKQWIPKLVTELTHHSYDNLQGKKLKELMATLINDEDREDNEEEEVEVHKWFELQFLLASQWAELDP